MSHFLPHDKIRCIRSSGTGSRLTRKALYCVHGTSDLSDGSQILWLSDDAYRKGEGWGGDRFELVHRLTPAAQ